MNGTQENLTCADAPLASPTIGTVKKKKGNPYRKLHVCAHCGADYWSRREWRKYCDDCFATHYYEKKGKTPMICTVCGQKYLTFHPLRAKFCSTKCYQKLRTQETPPETNLRWMVLVRDGLKCQYCGRTPMQHGMNLHVDHIVPKA